MRHVVSASLVVLVAALAQPALAQLEDKPVRMEKAPFHIPVFENDHIILLNVNIPPGRNTGYHIHYADSVSVNLTPASQTNQNYGSDEVSKPLREPTLMEKPRNETSLRRLARTVIGENGGTARRPPGASSSLSRPLQA